MIGINCDKNSDCRRVTAVCTGVWVRWRCNTLCLNDTAADCRCAYTNPELLWELCAVQTKQKRPLIGYFLFSCFWFSNCSWTYRIQLPELRSSSRLSMSTNFVSSTKSVWAQKYMPIHSVMNGRATFCALLEAMTSKVSQWNRVFFHMVRS